MSFLTQRVQSSLSLKVRSFFGTPHCGTITAKAKILQQYYYDSVNMGLNIGLEFVTDQVYL